MTIVTSSLPEICSSNWLPAGTVLQRAK